MNVFYGLVYDRAMNSFREDGVMGVEGIINIAIYLAELTQSDEEPYDKPIDTVEEALEFLDLYDYEVIQVTEDDYQLFESIAERNKNIDKRLSYELEEEFYAKAKDFKHEVFEYVKK